MVNRSDFLKGIITGLVIATLLSVSLLAYLYILPLQEKNERLKTQLHELQEKYDTLSFKYDSLVINYTSLNQTYLNEVQKYNALLAQYVELQAKYHNLTYLGNEKFIVLLFFTTNYGSNKYWLYLEIDPQLYFSYKVKEHVSISFQNLWEFKKYVVIDNVTKVIVNAVKSKLTNYYSDEELGDALLSLAQNKLIQGYNGEIYENLNNVPGVYYYDSSMARYPVETLILHSGNPLDNTILFLSLLKTAGFKCGFLFLPPQDSLVNGHVMAIVNLYSQPTHIRPYRYLWQTQINGTYYYPAETNEYGWRIGETKYDLKQVTSTPLLIN